MISRTSGVCEMAISAIVSCDAIALVDSVRMIKAASVSLRTVREVESSDRGHWCRRFHKMRNDPGLSWTE